MKTSFENVQVGERIAYNSGWGYVSLHFSTVKRLTKTQIILQNDKRFYKENGREVGDKHHPFTLWNVQEAEEHQIQKGIQDQKDKAARELIDALLGRRNGMNNYNLSSETVAQMVALTAALKAA